MIGQRLLTQVVPPVFLVTLLAALAIPTEAGGPSLRIEPGTPLPLVLDPILDAGLVFVYAAADVASLQRVPEILFQTNAPLPEGLRLRLPSTSSLVRQGFVRATHWVPQPPALVDIPAGTFIMGTSASEVEGDTWEGPPTSVTFARSFKMSKYEIRQEEYQAVMGKNPSYFTGFTNRPVEFVTWANAMEYCARLTSALRATGSLPSDLVCRLPTEAEWEYACRAGTTTAFAYGPFLRSGMANFDGRQEYEATVGSSRNPNGVANERPTTVGSYAPNAWGLYDMHGNLWEWCLDRWGLNLTGGSVTDPSGPSSGANRVVRGGCWYNSARVCRSGYRAQGNPTYKGNETGFRIVIAPESR